MDAPSDPPGPSVRPHLSLWDAVSIIVGIVIGAGIYETAPAIFRFSGGPWAALGIWALGGVLSLVGALCYAELATTYPRSGGDYVYLSRAYGSWAGFLFGWAQLAVIMTASIGMMAFVFANYAVNLWGVDGRWEFAFAAAAVAVLAFLNIWGVVLGKRTQNFLTSCKVIGLGGIVVAGFFWGNPSGVAAPAAAGGGVSFGLAMIFVLYTYGGWNDAAFVAAEVRDKRRDLPRALMLGTGGVALIYLLVNAAYLLGLGYEGASSSRAIAADALALPLGGFGSRAMSILVMISALGAVNGLTYTGSRIYATMGEDFRLFARLAQWHPRRGSPLWSLVAQAAIALAMILLVGTEAGRALINALLVAAGAGEASWDGRRGFDTLLTCTAPVFWLFFLLTGASLMVLRRKDRGIERPFAVPLFPVLPLVLCGTSLYMLYSAADYAGKLTLVGVAPLAVGAGLYLLSVRAPRKNATI